MYYLTYACLHYVFPTSSKECSSIFFYLILVYQETLTISQINITGENVRLLLETRYMANDEQEARMTNVFDSGKECSCRDSSAANIDLN